MGQVTADAIRTFYDDLVQRANRVEIQDYLDTEIIANNWKEPTA